MSTTLERLQYGYDRDSRRTWRRRGLTTGEDNAYGYDGLSQVTQSALGTLNQNCTAISASPAGQENWAYDPTGNWRGYRVELDGSVALDQSRIHDKGNRLTQIKEDPYPVILDRVGRVREISPGADGDWDESQKIKWDAWGRVTQVKRASDDAVLGAYAYDGLTRRTTRTVAGTTHHCYYSDQWRPLEERKNSQTTAELQYYWGARHRDDLVRRDHATTDGGSLDETRYVLMDYYSPAAITDATGAITERYAFSAFGIRRIMAPDFVPRSTSECNFEFAFQGQFLDTESGLLNYGFRHYSPYLGRWLRKDPIQETGGFDLYLFVDNNPLSQVDLFGLVSAGIVVSGEVSFDLCKGKVDIKGWFWAGFGTEFAGAWLGPAYTGEGSYELFTFTPFLKCGKCSCCDEDAKSRFKASSGWAANGFKESLGAKSNIAVGIVISPDGDCAANVEVIVLINLIDKLPGGAILQAAAAALGAKAQAGVQGNGFVRICAGDNGDIVVDSGGFGFGVFVDIGWTKGATPPK